MQQTSNDQTNIAMQGHQSHHLAQQQHQQQNTINTICSASTGLISNSAAGVGGTMNHYNQHHHSVAAGSISASTTPQQQVAQIQTIECSYKNCTLNSNSTSVGTSSTSKILSSSKSHRITAPDNINQYNAAVAAAAAATEASSQIINNSNSNSNKYTTILPPPLFDEGAATATTLSTHSSNPNLLEHQHQSDSTSTGIVGISAGANLKTPSSSRRYHRTIPRHLTAIDPLISNVNLPGSSGTLPAGSSASNLKYFNDSNAVVNNMQISKTNHYHSTSNTLTGTSSNTALNSNGLILNDKISNNNKKPTCQCPVQHVPMSYMGTNQISNQATQNSNIFLSTITNKLSNNNNNNSNNNSNNCNGSNSNSSSTNYKTKSPSGSKSLSQSKDSLNESSRNNTLKRSNHSSNSHSNNYHGSSSTSCQPTTPTNNKISTISKHVGELHQSSANHQIILKSTPVIKSKHNNNSGNSNSGGSQHASNSHNSSVNILRSGETVDMYNSSSFPVQLMESLSKISNESNPVLPPKMYKTSQSTNCSKQSQHVYTAVSKIHTICKPNDNSIITNAHSHVHHTHHYHSGPQRSSSTSRCTASGILSSSSHSPSNSSYTKSLSRKDSESMKSIVPTLTLPSSASTSNCNQLNGGVGGSNNGCSNNDKSQSMGKINSTTFYPMQNSHVTYTLPKHHSNGKQSLNSTIANVVSKVPSVISIPSTSMTPLESATLSLVAAAANLNEREMSQPTTTTIVANSSDCKRSTLPKVLKNQQSAHHDKTPTHITTIDTKNLDIDKPNLPVCTTSKNCSNPKEHFLPNDTSLDDDYLSECENCKTAHSSKYYLNDEETEEPPQETMTLQRNKDQDKEEEQGYYRTSLTLPTNTKKTTNVKNNREQWFSSIPASSSSDEELNE